LDRRHLMLYQYEYYALLNKPSWISDMPTRASLCL
jgi:hypothetical protein